ncbi:MAG: CPBP family intramembrane metalloprotease [Chloroflexi bacterium]|nr:CPBP family intramembrane metalloprotease [Chloroflexota bacterium]
MTTRFPGISIGALVMFVGVLLTFPAIVSVLLVRTGVIPPLPPPATIALALLFVLGAVIVLIGLVLYVLLPTRSSEEAGRSYAWHRTVLATFALAVVLANIITSAYVGLVRPILADTPDQPTPAPDVLFVGIAALSVSLLAVLYLRIVRPSVITWHDMGLTWQRFGARLAFGVAGGLVLLLVSALLENLLRQVGIEQTQAELFRGIERAPLPEFTVVLLAVAGLAPFAEEAFFRGYVFRAYLQEKGPLQAYLLSSALFAVAHLNLPALLPIFAIGLGLAYLTRSTGSILPSIVAHAVNNLVALTALYLGV